MKNIQFLPIIDYDEDKKHLVIKLEKESKELIRLKVNVPSKIKIKKCKQSFNTLIKSQKHCFMKFQPNILSDNISDLYDILFFYQKINNPLENNIFDFLLELNNEILSSKTSILCLEKYGKENNINPLFYSLIEKYQLKIEVYFYFNNI